MPEDNKKKFLEMFRATLEFCKQNGDNPLIDFWISKEHRNIDKWVHYFPIYHEWFKKFRGTDLVFVEIGVQNGGSAQMWKEYFGKDAKIIGIDIDERCKQFEDENITIEIGSQEDVNFWNEFKNKYPRVDILLDDGGHTMNQQIVTFQQMFPHIKEGGIYFCEDCHTSYYKNFGGSVGKPGTYIEFAKRLIDELNAFHTSGELNPTYNTIHMGGGIHFYDSIVVIEKKIVRFAPFSMRIGQPTIVKPADAML